MLERVSNFLDFATGPSWDRIATTISCAC